MDTLVVDFETYFDKDVNLRKMATLAYVRHPKFKVHGAAVKFNDQPSQWMVGQALTDYLTSVDWENTASVDHNSGFDNVVLHELYGAIPAQRIDTLGLCRALLPRDLEFDINAICPMLGLSEGKRDGGKALQAIKGVEHPTAEQLDDLGHYAIGDADDCYALYALLWPNLPESERTVMDLVIRMSTEGLLRGDPGPFETARKEIEDDRETKLKLAEVDDPAVLRSRDEFAALLRSKGVEPPTKITYTKKHPNGAPTYAFAKQDPEFVALQADTRVSALVKAKMAWASNNAISRIDSLATITEAAPHTLPVQLQYNGAHTGRLSGGGKINMQNLNARGVGSALRKGIVAPPGCVIIVYDLSGIELRLNMWFSGQDDRLRVIAAGGDIYIIEAADQFGVPADSIDKDTPEGKQKRQFGKIIQLGCGYGMGGKKFRIFCATGPLGMEPIYLSETDAFGTVTNYRVNNYMVKQSWDWLQQVAIPSMLSKSSNEQRGPITIEHEAIVLPNGMRLQYPGLTATEEGFHWGLNGRFHRIYGGITQENIIQSLAGVIMKQQMIDVDRELHGPQFHRWLAQENIARHLSRQLAHNPDQLAKHVAAKGALVHQVHDELLVVAREKDADDVGAMVAEKMTIAPDWAPGLPLAVEGGYDFCYSK